MFSGRFGKHGLAINLVDGPQTLEILRQIETHFGKPIQKLDAEDVDEIEKIQKNWKDDECVCTILLKVPTLCEKYE